MGYALKPLEGSTLKHWLSESNFRVPKTKLLIAILLLLEAHLDLHTIVSADSVSWILVNDRNLLKLGRAPSIKLRECDIPTTKHSHAVAKS